MMLRGWDANRRLMGTRGEERREMNPRERVGERNEQEKFPATLSQPHGMWDHPVSCAREHVSLDGAWCADNRWKRPYSWTTLRAAVAESLPLLFTNN